MTIPNLGRGGLPVYSPASSTASIANGARAVTFTGTALVAVDASTNAPIYAAGVGDVFCVSDVGSALIESIDSAGGLTLVGPWPFASQDGVSSWYIIRNSVPAMAYNAKAIQDALAYGADSSPNSSYTVDDSTARLKARLNGGTAQLAVGPTGTADASLKPAVQIDPATGVVSFPNGTKDCSVGTRNRLINGDFRVWQRGTVLTPSAATYTADRWAVTYITPTPIVSLQPAPLGFRSQWAMNIGISGATSGSFIDLYQRCESGQLYDLESKACTLSFDVNAATTAGAIVAGVFINGNTAADNGTFSTALMPFTAFALPVGSGKVVVPITAAQAAGLKFGAVVALRFVQLSATGNPSIWVGALQLEKGVVANDFEFRPYAPVLEECRRFYEPIYGYAASGQAVSSTQLIMAARMVPKRASPTINLKKTSIAGSGFELLVGGSFITASGLTLGTTFSAGDNSAFNTVWTGFSGLTPGQAVTFNTPILFCEAVAEL